MKPYDLPDAEALARIKELSERVLTPDEIRDALAIPLSEAEEEESRSLIRWFRRRYPTPAERLAYARRAYRRWTATHDRPRPASNPVRTDYER